MRAILEQSFSEGQTQLKKNKLERGRSYQARWKYQFCYQVSER